MTTDIASLKNELHDLRTRVDFLLVAFASLASKDSDSGIQLSEYEAYQGAMLGQELTEKMVKKTYEVLDCHLRKVG